jgi:hypothetical protein
MLQVIDTNPMLKKGAIDVIIGIAVEIEKMFLWGVPCQV